MPYVRKIIKSGDVLEIEEYFYPEALGGKPKPTQRISEEKQMEMHHRTRVKKLSRLINSNFTKGDLFLTLTFRKSVGYDQSKIDLRNFLRRLKRLRTKKDLPPLKYISVTETGSKSKMKKHHHLLINYIDLSLAELDDLWKQGRVLQSRLEPMGDYTGLAHYITKENKTKDENRWNRSRNLKEPVEEVIKIKRNTRYLKLPKEYADYRIVYSEDYFNDTIGSIKYLKAIAPNGHDYSEGCELLG